MGSIGLSTFCLILFYDSAKQVSQSTQVKLSSGPFRAVLQELHDDTELIKAATGNMYSNRQFLYVAINLSLILHVFGESTRGYLPINSQYNAALFH